MKPRFADIGIACVLAMSTSVGLDAQCDPDTYYNSEIHCSFFEDQTCSNQACAGTASALASNTWQAIYLANPTPQDCAHASYQFRQCSFDPYTGQPIVGDVSRTLHCSASSNCSDNDNDGYTPATGDCNDSDSNVHPYAQEFCGDGIDSDCVDGDNNGGNCVNLQPPGGGGGCTELRMLPPPGGCISGYEWSFVECACVPLSPIILDLGRVGVNLTSSADGVLFDLNGDGLLEQLSWTIQGTEDAFLALDRSGNSQIDDGTELFGNFTAQAASPEANGFLALAVFDNPENGGNGDGVISADDQIFTDLLLWIDANHNGNSEPQELTSLAENRIRSIDLDYRESRRRDRFGNEFRYRAKFYFEPPPRKPHRQGVHRFATDVFLVASQ